MITAAGLVCLAASVTGQDRPRVSLPVEHAELHFFSQPYKALRGSRAEFLFRLPAHVTFGENSEVRLGVDFSTNALPSVSGIRVTLNSEPLSAATWNPSSFVAWQSQVPRKLLQAGWNRLAIEISGANAAADTWDQPDPWGLWRSNSFLRLEFRRSALFPELARFPETYVEEKLLRNEFDSVCDIFIPLPRRDVYMRGLAILGARFGQLEYVRERDVRVRPISGWASDEEKLPNAILIARADELPVMPLPRAIELQRQSLTAEEGLVAEFILPDTSSQRRCLLVTGADDTGLEKALLTLGSSPALIWASPSPVVVAAAPEPRTDLAFLLRPHSGTFTFEALGWPRLFLQGATREQTFAGWRLPPGYSLGANNSLHLNILTSPGLTNSALEILVNGAPIGHLELTPEFQNLGTARIELPAGLRGRDPMTVTFRARFEPKETSWVSILGTSRLEVRPRQMDASHLQGLPSLVFPDPFLNKLAFAAPAESSWTELKSFFDVAMHLGRNLPSSQILWPEAVTYSSKTPPSSKRLRGRNVVVLGSAAQWSSALPAKTRLAINVDSASSETVCMQGRRYDTRRFEPGLGMVQLIPSPWDGDRMALVAGGWKTANIPAIYDLLTSPDANDYLFGNITVVDANGRSAAYDTRRGNSESLAERIQHELPSGLSEQETRVQRGVREALAAQARAVNRNVWVFAPVLLCVLVGARVWFTWDQHRQRRKALAGEKPLGSTI